MFSFVKVRRVSFLMIVGPFDFTGNAFSFFLPVQLLRYKKINRRSRFENYFVILFPLTNDFTAKLSVGCGLVLIAKSRDNLSDRYCLLKYPFCGIVGKPKIS